MREGMARRQTRYSSHAQISPSVTLRRALPDVGEQFSTQILPSRPIARHDAFGRRQNRNSYPAIHARDTVTLDVYAQARLADATEAQQARVTVRPVRQQH